MRVAYIPGLQSQETALHSEFKDPNVGARFARHERPVPVIG
jgi:hypothetical protein